jgi:hypothetical protein
VAVIQPASLLLKSLAVGLTVFGACLYAQTSAPPANPLMMSVGSNIGPGCGAAISPSAVQQDLEDQLRSAGLTVSKVHSARLSAEIDCVPVSGGAQKANIAVHQCLALSQVVSRQEQGREAILATTWRKCQAYTCGDRQCEVLARTGLRDLANLFVADSHQAVSMLEPLRSAAPPQATGTTAAGFGTTTLISNADTTYYVLYILACAVVFLTWQLRRRHAH